MIYARSNTILAENHTTLTHAGLYACLRTS